MPRGRLPTAIVATTVCVRGEMTEIVLGSSLLTYSSGSREAAGARARMRGVATATHKRRVDDFMSGLASVVEDRLVNVERLVEPAQAVASPDSLEDRPGQVGARYVGVRQVGAREVGPDQQRLEQVCPGEIC